MPEPGFSTLRSFLVKSITSGRRLGTPTQSGSKKELYPRKDMLISQLMYLLPPATNQKTFFALFDADHVPHRDFLKRTMGYFEDSKIAFVQTPQYYANRNKNFLTQASWEQQELFFGPLCQGKNRLNATFWCGTNAVMRREAILGIGGVPENNIAEDFLASLLIHKNGWNSLYIPEILRQYC